EEPNVKQLVAKVQLGEAEAAWVYSTDAAGADVRTIDVPDQFNVVAEYPAAVVKDAPRAELARAFLVYLLSDASRAVLHRSGFAVPAQRVAARLIPWAAVPSPSGRWLG